MHKILIITLREYLTRVRKKSFIITTLLAPLGFILFFVISVYITNFSSGTRQVLIVDQSGLFEEVVFPDKKDKSLYFKKLGLNSMEPDSGVYDVIITVPPHFDLEHPKKVGIRYSSEERLGLTAKAYIEETLSDKIRELRIERFGLDADVIEELDQKISLVQDDSDEANKGEEVAAVAGMVIGAIIYMSLFFYGTMIMKGVMEEKTNRIVEIIASSVKPFQLLMAKILGIGAVGLTQFALWVILIGISQLLIGIFMPGQMSGGMESQMGATQEMDPDQFALLIQQASSLNFKKIIGFFFFYFLGGYLLYGSLFAAVGAATNDDSDLQSLTIPISIPIIIGFFISFSLMNDPNGPLAVWGSIIPFTSPIVMASRIAFDPPVWQILLSMVLLIVGFVLTTLMAAKIYRTGILLYGKQVTAKEIFKWLLY